MKAAFARRCAAVVFGGALAALSLVAASCFEVPSLLGPYRCPPNGSCQGEGFVCYDGVCCHPTREPRCRGYVFPGDVCADGSPAPLYYEDLDGDGVGNDNHPRRYCEQPAYDRFVRDGGDCDDNAVTGASTFPGAVEQCDGLDNNCDGTRDEGLSARRYYRDSDQDGYGDPDDFIRACNVPPGYLQDSSDCAPTLASAHPGGLELCNGIDDDCNLTVDDEPSDVGGACGTGLLGACGAGRLRCLEGEAVCVARATPKPDVCHDELDQDCNGVADDRPGCGGPTTVLGPMATTGIHIAGLNLRTTTGGTVSTCAREVPNAVADTVTRQQGRILWSGDESYEHVLYAEPADGGYWDLTRASANPRLRLVFDYVVATGNPSPWAGHWQPVVLLCSGASMMRYVHPAEVGTSGLLTGPTGNFSQNIPLDGGLGWVVGSGSDPAVLQRVDRIEVRIQPANGGSVVPSFQLTVTEWGFP